MSERRALITGGAGFIGSHLAASESSIEYVPYGTAYGKGFEDMTRRVPDLTRIHWLIGYEPRTDLDGIITSVIEYLKR